MNNEYTVSNNKDSLKVEKVIKNISPYEPAIPNFKNHMTNTTEFLYKSHIVVALINPEEDFKVIKNRYSGNMEYLDEETSLKLISKILSNTIYTNNELLDVFSSSLQDEIIKKCREIINDHIKKDNKWK